MKEIKVTQVKGQNHFVLENDDFIKLQSYQSIVAVCDKKNESLIFGEDWNYSRTTLKYLYLFINDVVWLDLNANLREKLTEAFRSSNTKKALQKLIDNKIIMYDESL